MDITISLVRSSPGCTDGELEALDQSVGAKLPDDFASFLKMSNGGRPRLDVFDVRPGLADSITKFYSASEILEQRRALLDRLDRSEWPIADTSCGNYLLLKQTEAQWGVAFFDHETERVVPVAKSFAELVSKLRERVPVKLEPGQVKKVWSSGKFDHLKKKS